tara:strand:+ start:81 stop:737 length:657 start_codon:yes stop_codon:yes gene_type:complete
LVYKHAAPGKRMSGAMVGDKIDLNHPDAVAFCAQYDYQEPDGALIAAAARESGIKLAKHNQQQIGKRHGAAQPKPPNGSVFVAPEEFEDDEKADEDRTANEYLDMTVRELIARYGTQSQFKDLASAVKNLIQMRGYEEEQARKRGEYIHRSHAEKLVAMIDGMQKALLTDAVSNMANKAMVQARSNTDKADVERSMRDIISRVIKLSKTQIVRSLRDI